MEQVYAAIDIKSLYTPAQSFSTFGDLVTVIVKNAFVLAGITCFILLVLGGFTFIMGAGAGDTKELERGRGAIVGAITGLIVVVGSFWIIQIIEKLTGIRLLSP